MPYKYLEADDQESWDDRGKKEWISKSYTPKQAEAIITKYIQTHNFNKAFDNDDDSLEYTTNDLIDLLQILESSNTPPTDCDDVDLKRILIKKLTIYDLRTQLTSDAKTKMKWQKMFLDTVTTLHKLDKDIALKMKDQEIEKKETQISRIMKKLQNIEKDSKKDNGEQSSLEYSRGS